MACLKYCQWQAWYEAFGTEALAGLGNWRARSGDGDLHPDEA
jgi:hypothetical protein